MFGMYILALLQLRLLVCVCVCLQSPSLPGAGSSVWALVLLLAPNPAGCGDQCFSVCVRVYVCVCLCACVHEHRHVLLLFPPLLFFWFLRLGWLFYLSKNLERLWDFFPPAWLSAALPLSLSAPLLFSHSLLPCVCCGSLLIDFICCCSWHQY